MFIVIAEDFPFPEPVVVYVNEYGIRSLGPGPRRRGLVPELCRPPLSVMLHVAPLVHQKTGCVTVPETLPPTDGSRVKAMVPPLLNWHVPTTVADTPTVVVPPAMAYPPMAMTKAIAAAAAKRLFFFIMYLLLLLRPRRAAVFSINCYLLYFIKIFESDQNIPDK